jgi:hypothetical protein
VNQLPDYSIKLDEGTLLCKNSKIAWANSGCLREHELHFMKVGDRVRVSKSVIVYNNPSHRNEPFDVKGLEGDVVGILVEWRGRPVSANLPVQVKFDKKFQAHFREDELEIF